MVHSPRSGLAEIQLGALLGTPLSTDAICSSRSHRDFTTAATHRTGQKQKQDYKNSPHESRANTNRTMHRVGPWVERK